MVGIQFFLTLFSAIHFLNNFYLYIQKHIRAHITYIGKFKTSGYYLIARATSFSTAISNRRFWYIWKFYPSVI